MSADFDVPSVLILEENRDILAELTDPAFVGRKHYNKSVYADGCRGPLCRKRERDLGRAARQALAEAEGRVYQPGRTPRMDGRDELLEAVFTWHCAQLEIARERAKVDRETRRIRDRIKSHEERAAELHTRLEGLTA